MALEFETETALRVRTDPPVSLKQPTYFTKLSVVPHVAPGEAVAIATAVESFVLVTEGLGTLSGQDMDAAGAASGPGVIVMHPGSLEIIPFTSSPICRGLSGQLYEYPLV